MTIYTIYANTNDHYVDSSNNTYSTARAGSGLVDDTSGAYMYAGQDYDAPTYYVKQAFLSFDTSAVISGQPASLSLTIYVQFNDNPATYDVDIVNWTAGTGSFVAGTSLSAQSEFGTATLTGTGDKVFSSTTNPARSSTYKLMIYGHRQETNSAPTGIEYIRFRSADWVGTATDPYLTIDVTWPVYYFQRDEYLSYMRI